MEPEVYMGIDPKRSSKQGRGGGKPGRDLREEYMPQELVLWGLRELWEVPH